MPYAFCEQIGNEIRDISDEIPFEIPEYFAYASGIDNGRYIDLKYNKAISFVDKTGYLVRLDPARKQLLAEASAQPSNPVSVPVDNLEDNISKPVITETVTDDIDTNQVLSAVQQPTQFFM